ncbi:MAG: cell division protein FtsW, partial [Kribbellaceae bacterium]|nr:cell division protein FtsW [Kribbellaceae bacterium]
MTITDQSKNKANQPAERPWLTAIKDVLDRPLTSYHILLGASGLLLVLGILMVLSASSVQSLRTTGNSYTIFYRQLIWVGVGLPMAYVASRMTPRHFRMLAYVALLGSVFLLVLTYIPGIGKEVNGNTNWISFGGPLQIQPSEFAKLALVMWCADLYARKQKLLTQWKHLLVPMVPVCGLVIALIVGQHDLGTSLVLMAVMIGM